MMIGCNWCDGYSAWPYDADADTAVGTVFLLERDIAEFMDDDIELFREEHHG